MFRSILLAALMTSTVRLEKAPRSPAIRATTVSKLRGSWPSARPQKRSISAGPKLCGVAITTTTDADGLYKFVIQETGTFTVTVDETTLPAGLTQTGDPDTTLDDRTTAPIVLAPGDEIARGRFIRNMQDAFRPFRQGHQQIRRGLSINFHY